MYEHWHTSKERVIWARFLNFIQLFNLLHVLLYSASEGITSYPILLDIIKQSPPPRPSVCLFAINSKLLNGFPYCFHQ